MINIADNLCQEWPFGLYIAKLLPFSGFLMCTNLLKESIMFMTEALEKVGVSSIIKIAPIDLDPV